MLDPAPDPLGVAAEILDPERPKSSTERSRAHRERRAAEAATPAAPVAPPITGEDMAGMMGFVWDTVAVPLAGKWDDGSEEGVPRLKALTEAQQLKLGNAWAPVMQKHGAALAAWVVELTAVVVTVGVVRQAMVKAPVVLEVNFVGGNGDAAVPTAPAHS